MDVKNNEQLNRFLSYYTKLDPKSGCRIWTGSIDKNTGYGTLSMPGGSVHAHRIVYSIIHGDYPKYINGRKTCVRHLCNNRLCVNPKHLALGTYTDNTRDASMAGRNTKMTMDKLILAIKLRKEGLTYRKIGKIIELGEMVVSTSLRGKTYYCREMLKEIGNHLNH